MEAAQRGGRMGTKVAPLARVVAREIIPRLLAAHPDVPVRAVARIGVLDVEVLARMALEADSAAIFDHVEDYRARGVAVPALFIELIAPAARLLGEQWEADSCDFVDVTRALWRLSAVVRAIASRAPGAAEPVPRAILIAVVPGDDHSFGAMIADELFRRAGWDSTLETGADASALRARAGSRRWDVIALSATCDGSRERMADLIRALRAAAPKPAPLVIAGGRAIGGNDALARALGADYCAGCASSAVLAAELMLVERGCHERLAA